MNSWDYTYRGKRVRDGYEYEYKLQTVSVDNVGATSPFDYGVMPKSLTVTRRPLKETDEPSRMKIAAVQEQKQKLEQQSYEDFADNRRLYGKLGIRTPDRLGLFYSDFLESQSQATQRQTLREIDAAFNQQVQKQKNAAAQEQIKEITGSVPIRELLGTEEKLLHVALKQDDINSYREYGADGSSVVHTAFTPVNCNNPRCGICNNAAQIEKTQNQKVASSSSTSKFVAGSTREFDDISDYLFH
jgi:hypothetical protein